MTSIDTFIHDIEKRKEKEIHILENTLAKKKEDIKRTKATRIKELQEYYLNEAKTKSNREATRIIEAGKLKAKKILFDAINANMDSTFDVIKHEMNLYISKPEYTKILIKMINYAKNVLGEKIIVHCRDNDKLIFKDMNIPAGYSINAIGGIIAEDEEGKREIDLTFEELLRTSEDDVKSFLLGRMVK
jgi:V/A-type H+-transporting ATPase subunit E